MKERKIVEYCTVLNRNYIKDFDDSINTKIRTGWQPLGGVSTLVKPNGAIYFVQALVKYEEPQEEEL